MQTKARSRRTRVLTRDMINFVNSVRREESVQCVLVEVDAWVVSVTEKETKRKMG